MALGLVWVAFGKLPTILLFTKSPESKSFVMGERQGENKKREEKCSSRNALSWVLSPLFTRHFLYYNTSD